MKWGKLSADLRARRNLIKVILHYIMFAYVGDHSTNVAQVNNHTNMLDRKDKLDI
jgi:hypothetical protein